MNPLNLPAQFIAKNGRQIIIRRITPQDAPLLVDLYLNLSEESIRLRFHAFNPNVSEEDLLKQAKQLSGLDWSCQAAIVATVQQQGRESIVGVARFSRAAPADTQAEAAIVIRDDFQGIGLGKTLMKNLGQIALIKNIVVFNAWVMAENRTILSIVSNFGYPVTTHTSKGETHVVISLTKN